VEVNSLSEAKDDIVLFLKRPTGVPLCNTNDRICRSKEYANNDKKIGLKIIVEVHCIFIFYCVKNSSYLMHCTRIGPYMSQKSVNMIFLAEGCLLNIFFAGEKGCLHSMLCLLLSGS